MKQRLSIPLVFGIGLLVGLLMMYSEQHLTNVSHDQEPNFIRWINLTIGDLQYRRWMWNKYNDRGKQPQEQRLPNIIGIGARKCGTGILQAFLGRHPLVHASVRETHYYDKNRGKGLEYYRHILPAATKSQLVAEKTPAYFRSRPFDLPEIIDREIPDVKLWLCLCDPVARAFSDFVMRMERNGRQIDKDGFQKYTNSFMPRVKSIFKNWPEDFDGLWNGETVFKELEKNVSSYTFAHGIYAYYIKRWMKVFPANRLLIVDGEELLQNPGSVIESLQDFLQLPKVLLKQDFIRHPKTGLYCLRPWWESTYDFLAEYRRYPSWENGLLCSMPSKGRTRSKNVQYTISPHMKSRLQKFFEPYNHRLFEILNRTLPW